MKEYRVKFTNLPGGPDDPAIFVELEDDQGNSLGGPDYPWEKEGDSIAGEYAILVLPTYEEKFKACRNTLSNIRNSIEWLASNEYDPRKMLQEILTEVEEALEEIV